MKTVKIALLGFGTVSQGTFNLLQDNVDLITNRSGVTIEISKIFVRNPDKYTNITLQGRKYTTLKFSVCPCLLCSNANLLPKTL